MDSEGGKGSLVGPRGPIVCVVHDRIVGVSWWEVLMRHQLTTKDTIWFSVEDRRKEGRVEGWMQCPSSSSCSMTTLVCWSVVETGHRRPGDSLQLTTWSYLSKRHTHTHTHTHIRHTLFRDNNINANVIWQKTWQTLNLYVHVNCNGQWSPHTLRLHPVVGQHYRRLTSQTSAGSR